MVLLVKRITLDRYFGTNVRTVLPTFETLSLMSSDMPEKSAWSPKASVMPNSFSVSSRAASTEMANLGKKTSTELRKTILLIPVYSSFT